MVLAAVISPDIMVCTLKDFFPESNNSGKSLNESSKLAILTRVSDNEIVPKRLVELAIISYMSDNIIHAVTEFNQNNNDYRIVINDYTLNSLEKGIEMFNLDITTGKIPDMVLFGESAPYESYASKKLFTDLYNFLDNDPDITRDDIFKAVRGLCETNDKLYRIPTSFTYDSNAGRENIKRRSETTYGY